MKPEKTAPKTISKPASEVLASTWFRAISSILVLLLIAPYVFLGAVGIYWLVERGWSLVWLAVSLVVTIFVVAVGYLLSKQLRYQQIRPVNDLVEPATRWPPIGRDAWTDVEAIALRVGANPPDLERPEEAWKIIREVIETVAKRYHPLSDKATLEMPLPHLMRVIELAARDLRLALSENVPGTHVFTINDMLKMKRLYEFGNRFYLLYRLASFTWNPASALMRELNILATGRMANETTVEVKRWAIEFAIKRIGYYAIELYSGYLVLDNVPFEVLEQTTPGTAADEQLVVARDEKLSSEPLRILVVGQVKAGKSSLINAIFRDTKAAVDIVPRTSRIEPYKIDGQDGLPAAILLDSGGYDDATDTRDYFADAKEEVEKSDLVLLVTSAMTAARSADRRLLDDLRLFFAARPDREMPPVVVVLTHIDQLRPFREWSPPYNLQSPQGTKAENIRAAIDTVAADLGVPPEQVIPVCLAEDRRYNIDDGVIPAIGLSLSDAQRLRYLRCLKNFHDKEYWDRLWRQSLNAGRLVGNITLETARHALRHADVYVKKWLTK